MPTPMKEEIAELIFAKYPEAKWGYVKSKGAFIFIPNGISTHGNVTFTTIKLGHITAERDLEEMVAEYKKWKNTPKGNVIRKSDKPRLTDIQKERYDALSKWLKTKEVPQSAQEIWEALSEQFPTLSSGNWSTIARTLVNKGVLAVEKKNRKNYYYCP